jgi:hypothetical protein
LNQSGLKLISNATVSHRWDQSITSDYQSPT